MSRFHLAKLMIPVLCAAFLVSCSDETGKLDRGTYDVDLTRHWDPADLQNTDFLGMFKHFWRIDRTYRNQRMRGGPFNTKYLKFPRYPKPDIPSVSHVHKWDIAYRTFRKFSKTEAKMLAKLDALVNVGLLEKKNRTIVIDGRNVAMFGYSFTSMGWKYLRSRQQNFALAYAAPEVMHMTEVSPRYINAQVGLEVVAVTASIGVSGPDALAPWARDPEVQTLFPEIVKTLKGVSETRYFIRGARGWTDFNNLNRYRKLQGKPIIIPLPKDYPDETKQNHKEAREYTAKMASLEPPTEAEIKALIEKRIGKREAISVPLPGHPSLPVDKVIGPGFKVAIFENKDRKHHKDRLVITKTLPYLKRLMAAGIVVKVSVRGWEDPPEASSSGLVAHIFSFAPKFNIPSYQGAKVNLGKMALSELVDFGSYDDPLGPGIRFSYKYRAKLADPPAWATNPELLKHWPDLRKAIEIGRAGDGDYRFDRERRNFIDGGGSEWWAFATEADRPAR